MGQAPKRPMSGLTLQITNLARLNNATHPVLAIVAGYFAAQSTDKNSLVLSIVVFVLLHSAVTIWNDIEDEQIDVLNGRRDVVTIRKAGQLNWLWVAVVVLFVLAGIGIFFLPIPTAVLFGIFFVLGWMYNTKPLQLSRHPWGSIVTMWLTYGVLPFGIGLSFGKPGLSALLLGFGWSLSRLSLSFMKDFKDATGDARSDKKTFLLVYGKTVTTRWSYVLAIIGLTTVAVMTSIILKPIVLLPLLILATWLLFERAKLFRTATYKGLHHLFYEQTRYQLFFDGFVVLCLSI